MNELDRACDSNAMTAQVQGAMPWTRARQHRHLSWLLPLLLFACMPTVDKEESLAPTGENHPPVVRGITIQPTPLILSGPILAIVQAQDDDGDNLHFRYRWFANGKLVGEHTRETVDPKLFKRGDTVVVEVIPFDGKDHGTAFKSQAVVIGNTPPIVSNIAIEPDEQALVRRLVVKADVSDPDGDMIAIVYRWKKNETVVKEGEASELDIAGFSTKDSIQVDILASDGITEAKPVPSNVFVLNNTAPKITSLPVSALQGSHYEYQVTASDPDGDPITYGLEGAPLGMTIDARSGMLRWTPGADAVGVQHVRIMAKDARGAFATQEFELSLSVPAKAS
jgi:Putative Ig domain